MQYWTNAKRLLRTAALCGGWVWLALSAAAADLPHMRVYQQGVALMLDAQVPLQMPPETEAVLRRGVPLAILQEVNVIQSRWYWKDAVLAQVRREWTLSYQALTQRWRVMLRDGQQVEQFDDVNQAWQFLTTVRQWPIADVTQLGALQGAQAELSWRVDRRVNEGVGAGAVGVLGGDVGASWRLSTVGRAPIPVAVAPVRDALPSGKEGS